jgi:hypothetical protein
VLTGKIRVVLRENVWYNNAPDVKYWHWNNNKWQFRLRRFAEGSTNPLISATYSSVSLAQKLHYFLSPIKKHLLVTRNKNHQE